MHNQNFKIFAVIIAFLFIMPLNLKAGEIDIDYGYLTFRGRIFFMYSEHGGAPEIQTPLNNFPVNIIYFYDYTTKIISVITGDDGSFSYKIPALTPNQSLSAKISVIADDGISSFVLGSGVVAGIFSEAALSPSNALRHNTPLQTIPSQGVVDFGYIIADHSGAFNIVRTIRKGFDLLEATPGATPPRRIPVIWDDPRHLPFLGNLNAMYNFYAGYIFILNCPQIRDEFNKSLILHEYGHVVMFDMLENNIRDNPYNGRAFVWQSNWSKMGFDFEPRFAFSEGWASFFGQWVLADPVYRIGRPGWGLRTSDFSLENPTSRPGLGSYYTHIGSPLFNAAVMWHIADGLDLRKIDPFTIEGAGTEQINRDFGELFAVVAYTMNNSGFSLWTSPDLAEILPERWVTHYVSNANLYYFFRNYLNKHIQPNSIEALNFWKVFNYNGMQFDRESPVVNITSMSIEDNYVRMEGTSWDNIMVERVELHINGEPKAKIRYNTDNFYFEFVLPNSDTDIKVKAFDFAGNSSGLEPVSKKYSKIIKIVHK